MEDGLLSLKWNNHKTTFFENLKILRDKSSYTDVILAVEDKFYPVHKLVMSTCSEYFSEILERTFCKSPVIVLKDVQCHDIEALLDYMYLGEVNVNQNDLPSLLKTAEGLRIKGLAVPDEDSTKLSKNSTSSHDEVHRESPPPKKRRHDSNLTLPHANSPVSYPQMSATTLVNSAETSSIPPHLTSNTSNTKQNEPLFVKVEMDDGESQNERFRGENSYDGDASSGRDPDGDYGSDLSRTEHKPDNYSNVSFSGPSQQQFTHSASITSNPEKNEPPDVKVEIDNIEEQDERFRRENTYEGGTSSDQDPLEDYGYNLSETEHKPENYGDNASLPGTSLQQTFLDQWLASLDGRGKNVKSLSLARYNDILLQLKYARSKECQKTNEMHKLVKRFEVVIIGDREKLIKKRKTDEDPFLYFVPNEELFTTIHEIHLSLGHAGINRMQNYVKNKYANITGHSIILYISLCEKCELRRNKVSNLNKFMDSQPLSYQQDPQFHQR